MIRYPMQTADSVAFEIHSVSPLFRFPIYRNREEAENAGIKLAPYTTTRPVKSWIDPNPPAADEFGDVKYLMIACTRNGCGETALVDDAGNPYLRSYKMTREEALTLNIPPKGDFPDKPQPLGEWNVPCRPLAATEELFFAFGGLPVVREKSSAPAPTAGTSVSAAIQPDIELLKAGQEEIIAMLKIISKKIVPMIILCLCLSLNSQAADAPLPLTPEDAKMAAAAKLQMAQDAQRVSDLNARAQKLQSEAQSLQSQAVVMSVKANASQQAFVSILAQLRAKSRASAECGLDNHMNWVIPLIAPDGSEQFKPCPVAKTEESGQ